jgi:hypothetical protein
MSTTTFTFKQDELVCLGERYPSKILTVKTECSDLDAHEMLDLFKDFMVGCGYAEKSFYDACETATQDNPYAKSRNRPSVEQTDEIRHSWHEGVINPQSYTKEEVRNEYPDNINY